MIKAARPLTPPVRRRTGWRRQSLPGLFTFLALWLGAWPGEGPSPVHAAPLQDQQNVTVPVNKSRILDLRDPVARVSVANPAIADILVINPKQIYLNGKELGATNMILWDDKDQVQRQIGLEVTHDLEAIKERLYRSLPGERIRVESSQGAIVLSGTASSPARMQSALQLAQTFAGKQENVINMMQVGGAQQVLLQVKVAELDRTLGKKLDSDLIMKYDDGGGFKIGLVNFGKDSLFGIDTSGIIGNIVEGNFSMEFYLDMAESQGLAKILAEPNLTTLSGQKAEFLSGGEFPVPVESDDDGGITVEFKKYGIELNFVPFVLDSGMISLKVNVRVSELSNDASQVISVGQGTLAVPSLRVRGADATVEVPNGQTIAIAGMLNEEMRDGVTRFPGLGRVPVLGTFFRSTEFTKRQTELVIFVTPRFANSFAPEEAKVPTDQFIEPSDVEFYLMGKIQGRRPTTGDRATPKSSSSQRLGPDKKGTEGLFGHDL